MDATPKNEDDLDSGIVSSSFETSSRMFESTPKTESDSTPRRFTNNPKKRKAQYCDIKGRALKDLLESCPPTPQFSSTLNESLTKDFENIKIESNYFNISSCDGPAPKFFKVNGCEKIVTPPSTPESHLENFNNTPRKTGNFQKCSTACAVPSPLKEQHEILYPNLKPLDPLKKPLTPQKLREKLDKSANNSTSFKRTFFATRDYRLFGRILSNDVVMGNIFEYLSNGDLFRVSMVSKSFREALCKNTRANRRYQLYRESHKKNKENYKITPPNSPESSHIFPAGSVSPKSRNFREFVELGSNLSQNQSLIKCPICGKPSVVEKSIAQCQEINSCGFIFCQKCDSFAYTPEDFIDRCQGSILVTSANKKRRRLEDLSNSSIEFSVSSILSSTSDNNYSSGYYSGYDSSRNQLSVKRNLNNSFAANESSLNPIKALLESNRSPKTLARCHKEKRRSSSGSVLPVVQNENGRKSIEVIEPSSPPKVKTYSACSKQSKRNLKRLTR